MARLNWIKQTPYLAGVDRGVLYLPGVPGVAWNGLTEVIENEAQVNTSPVYFEGIKVGQTQSEGDFTATIKAFTYPPALDPYLGTEGPRDSQSRKSFGFSYRAGKRVHLVYNATAKPSAVSFLTNTSDPKAAMFQIDVETQGIAFTGIRPTAHVILDPNLAPAPVWASIEETIYGSATKNPLLPTIENIVSLYQGAASFQVIDNGDGTWTAIADGSKIQYVDEDTVTLTSPTVLYVSTDTYSLSSST